MRRTASGLRGLFPGTGTRTISRSESGGRPSRLPRSARATGTLTFAVAEPMPDLLQDLTIFAMVLQVTSPEPPILHTVITA